jgi:hypothetical protein
MCEKGLHVRTKSQLFVSSLIFRADYHFPWDAVLGKKVLMGRRNDTRDHNAPASLKELLDARKMRNPRFDTVPAAWLRIQEAYSIYLEEQSVRVRRGKRDGIREQSEIPFSRGWAAMTDEEKAKYYKEAAEPANAGEKVLNGNIPWQWDGFVEGEQQVKIHGN